MSNLRASTNTYISLFPTIDGRGKWHAAYHAMEINSCYGRNTVVLDLAAAPMTVSFDDERPHPIACRMCIKMWRAAVRREMGVRR